MKIGIVGSRRRDEQDDFLAVAKALQSLLELKLQPNEEVILVSGGCPKGGDRFAEDLAKQLGYEMVIHPADWKRYGRGAGFVRNTDIATGSDYLIACVAGCSFLRARLQEINFEGRLKSWFKSDLWLIRVELRS